MRYTEKKKLISSLGQLYLMPNPQKKEDFLRTIRLPELSFREFICIQMGYIRKWNWILAIAIFFISLYVTRYMQDAALWTISAMTPFLALATVLEGARSRKYGMEELEMSSRFSLKVVILARIGTLGLGDLIFIIAIIPFLIAGNHGELVIRSIYILVPYLASAFMNFYIIRKAKIQEGGYYCIAATVSISGFHVILITLPQITERIMEFNLIPVFILLFGVLAGKECRKMLQQWEVYE